MPSTEKKFKAFALVTYAEPDTVTEILESKYNDGTLTAYAHILHDKDNVENENGALERKTPHTHIVLTTISHRTATSVKNWFKATRDFKGELANTMVQSTRTCIHKDGRHTLEPIDVQGATFYLVHEDKDVNPLPNKHHYDWAEVTARNLESLKNPPVDKIGRPKKEDKTFEILQELMNGANPFILAQKYGRDFILNYRKYCDVVNACAQYGEFERIKKQEEENTYKRFTDGLYDISENGEITEMEISVRAQNDLLIENNAKLMDEVSTLRAKLKMKGIEE